MSHELHKVANTILRKGGFSWNGLPRKEADSKQAAFEWQMLLVPTGKQPRRRGIIVQRKH